MSSSHFPASFVNPSNLSLPSSSSLKRPVSPSSSREDSPDAPAEEPPRKRPRSTMTPEERREARAHRNRIAAQNSRDRRKAQFTLLEHRVLELEEENRRLRSGLPMSGPASSSAPYVYDSEIVTIQQEQERDRKRAEEQRERENLELRERIRTLEMGYEALLQALATQGAHTPALPNIHTPTDTSSSALLLTSTLPPSPASTSSPSTGDSTSPAAPSPTTLATFSYPLSPAPTHSTVTNSPVMFSGDSLNFPLSPAFSLSNLTTADSPAPVDVPEDDALAISSTGHAPTRHLARVATTAVHAAVSLQRVGSTRLVMGQARAMKCATVLCSSLKTKQPQTLPSRVCSQRSSHRRRRALVLFQVLALRQKRARRC